MPASRQVCVGGLFPELRQALLTARLRELRPDALMPTDVIDLATRGGARCLGREDIGRRSYLAPIAGCATLRRGSSAGSGR